MITGKPETLIQGGLIAVDQSDRNLSLLCSNKSNSKTLYLVRLLECRAWYMRLTI